MESNTLQTSGNPLKKFFYIWTSLLISLSVKLTQIGIFIFFLVKHQLVVQLFVNFTLWVQAHPFEGMLSFATAFILATALMIPSSVFALGTAYLWFLLLDPLQGFLSAVGMTLICSILSSCLTFFVSRYFLKQAVVSWIKDDFIKTRAVFQALKNDGLKIIILCRLSSIIPFSVFNFFLGTTSISFLDYFLASIGMFPMICFHVYCAMTVKDLSVAIQDGAAPHAWYIVALVLGGLFLVFSVVLLTWRAKKELQRILQDESLQSEVNPILTNYQTISQSDCLRSNEDNKKQHIKR